MWKKFKKTNKQKQLTAEVHANIVVIVSLYADCRTKRTRVHEEHKSQRRSHLTYSQSQVLFIYYLYILNIDSCQWCRLWHMTNDVQVIVEWSAPPLHLHHSCSIREQWFKTRGSGGIDIEWRGFLFSFFNVFVSRRWAMGVDRGFFFFKTVYFLVAPVTWLISVKDPLVENTAMGRRRFCGLETLAGCSLIAEACSCLGGRGCLYIHGCIRRPCLGNVNGRYGTKTRQSPEIVIKVHHCSSPQQVEGSRLWSVFFFFL